MRPPSPSWSSPAGTGGGGLAGSGVDGGAISAGSGGGARGGPSSSSAAALGSAAARTQSRSRATSQRPRPFSLSPFPDSSKASRSRQRKDDDAGIVVNVRIHERSYSDQEVIIHADCITSLSAFSYESDLVEVTPIVDDGDAAGDPHHRRTNRTRTRDHRHRQQRRGRTRVHSHLDPDGPPIALASSSSAPKYFLFKAKPDPKPKADTSFADQKEPNNQISIQDSIANAFGFKAYSKAVIRKVSSQLETLDHIELTFREQYVGRAEMWRLAMSLEDRCLYVGQKINLAGIVKATVTRLWIDERRVHCGYVAASTKPIFRSESAKINLFIQLAREMWEFDEDGELYYEKCLTGFIPALLRRWRAAETNHVISVILFARVFYDEDEVELLRRQHQDDQRTAPIREDGKGRFYADYFKVVLDLESYPDWSAVMETLKEEFFRFQHDILLLRRHQAGTTPETTELEPEKSRILQQTALYKSGYQDSQAVQLVLREQVALAGSISYSYEGCILEAINLTLNPFDEHYIDRDLTRTGLSLIFVTAGTGHFEVNKKSLRLTTERMIECGIGLDLVCLTKMPLHSVPLFKFSGELPDQNDYYYPERWEQAGIIGRDRYQHPLRQHHHHHHHHHHVNRPPIPPTFAHPSQWAPKNSQAQAPDPLYFDSARNSVPDSPQFATSSAASTLGRASTAQMTASTVEVRPSLVSSEMSTGDTRGQALVSSQAQSQLEFYSMPHWIDCSFYNLQMDKPFRADRFVPRCKMFEVQMMGIMENELADISIPYLDERPFARLLSAPGTPGLGPPQLSPLGAGAVTSPYGLGPGFGSLGIGSMGISNTLTQSNFNRPHLSSKLGIISTAGDSYFDSRGDPVEAERRADRQRAREQFDEDLFKPAEPAHLSGLRNAHGQMMLYGTGVDRILVGENSTGAVTSMIHGNPSVALSATSDTRRHSAAVSPNNSSATSPRPAQPRAVSRPREQQDQDRPLSPEGMTGARNAILPSGSDGPSSISPEKDPGNALRARSHAKLGRIATRTSASHAGPDGLSVARHSTLTPVRGNAWSNFGGDSTDYDASGDSTATNSYRPFRLPLTRSISQTESIRSSSTAPTIRRARGQLPGTLEWIGRGAPAEAASDYAALMLYHSGDLDHETGDPDLSALQSSPSISGRLLPPPITPIEDLSPANQKGKSRPSSRESAKDTGRHSALVSSGSRASPTTPSSQLKSGSASVRSTQTGADSQHKGMADYLRRGLTWWGGGSAAQSAQGGGADAPTVAAGSSVSRTSSSGAASLEGVPDTTGEAYRTLNEALAAVRADGASSGPAAAAKATHGATRPPPRLTTTVTSPEVPKVPNPRQIAFKIQKGRPTGRSPAASPTSTPIAIASQSPLSRDSNDLVQGQSQREMWSQNAREAEAVKQRALESERAGQQIAAQVRIEKQTLVNPSNPHKNRATFSSQLGRWQHLFPTRTNRHTVKWLSMTSPACLPLTTLYLPLKADLDAHWKESPYTITASTEASSILTKRNATTAPAVAIVREMASQRLAQGFQFIVPSVGWNNDEHIASHRSFDPRGSRHVVLKHHPSDLFQAGILTSGHPVLLSLPNEIHQISCDQGLVKVKRYLRNTEYDTSPIDYACFIWARNLPTYQTVHASFRYPDSAAYDWNYLDSIISGVEEPRFTESLRYWRTRFVLVPTEADPKEMLAPNGSPFTNEEIRLMGMDKLADLFMKARFRPQQQAGERAERGRPKGWDLRFVPTSLDPAASVHDENFMKTLEQFVQERAKERDHMGLYHFPSSKGKRIADLDLEDIVKEMLKEDGLKIADRTWHRMRYSNVFTGAELVTWLCRKFDDVRSREEAVEWGARLQEQGLFTHAGLPRGFIDGHTFYSISSQWTGAQQSAPWYSMARLHRDSSVGPRKVSSASNVDSASGDRSSTPRKRRKVQMSHTMYVDLAAGRKSDRYETAILHHDIAHNPSNGFNFQIHWLGTTARFVEDTIRNWTTTVERYGLRLIEAPVDQIKDISKHNPFQAPMRIKLAVAPPPTREYAHLLPAHVLPEQFFEYAILRYFWFVLDQEAADRYPDNLEIVYDSRPPRFDYSQFVHESGSAFVQVLGGRAGFLWLTNRLFTSHLPANSRSHGQRGTGRGGQGGQSHGHPSGPSHERGGGNATTGGHSNSDYPNAQTPTAAHHTYSAQAQADAESLRQDLVEFCANADELRAFYSRVLLKLRERAEFNARTQREAGGGGAGAGAGATGGALVSLAAGGGAVVGGGTNVVLATRLAEESEMIAVVGRRKRRNDILWSK